MKLKPGDRVKLMSDTGVGRLVKILDKNTALVEIEDGFEIPVLISELVPADAAYFSEERNPVETKKPGTQIIPVGKEEEPEAQDIRDEEIVLAIDLKKGTTEIRSWLINSSSYHLHYAVSAIREGEDELVSEGSLEPDTKVFCGRIYPDKIGEEMVLNAAILFYGKKLFRFKKPLAKTLRFLPADIYNGSALSENEYLEQNAAILNIFSFREKTGEPFENKTLSPSDLRKHFDKRLVEAAIPAEKREPQTGIEEVDLHIEAITDNFAGLSNGEIITLQLDRFRTSLDTAIIHKTKKIVFIHGVGNGKLKYELCKELDRKYPDLKYQDASFREYGYGATMVFVK
jgi:hypothetical protein